jgi:phosphonate transport system substrate-binding protein
MLSRRQLVGGTVVVVASSFAQVIPALAWKDKYPELTFAAVPDENASGMTDRYTPLTAYMTLELGVPVKLRIAQD